MSLWGLQEQSGLFAMFVDRTELRFAEAPSTRSEGDCTLTRWALDATSPRERRVSVGEIVASGTGSCSNSDFEQYLCLTFEERLWEENARLVTVTASGGELPAFSAMLEAPLYPDSYDAPFRTSGETDLEITWSGGSGVMRAQASSASVPDAAGATHRLDVRCEVPAELGRLVVPRSMLRELIELERPDGAPIPMLTTETVTRVAIEVGGFPTIVEAEEGIGGIDLVP